MITILHTGDLGDVIACLPILRSLGTGFIAFTEAKSAERLRHPRESLRGARFEALKPLLDVQDYVIESEWMDEPDHISHDLSDFRTVPYLHDRENLAQWQARYLGVEISLEQWLTVPKCANQGHIVIARSLRYHNFFFPWDDLLFHYRKERVVFVGLPHEHEALERAAHRKVEYRPTKTLLDLAQVVAGARLFIGNQSAPFWIAAGLGVPLIQESWEPDLNSIVQRPDAIYTPTPLETRTLMERIKYEEVVELTRRAYLPVRSMDLSEPQ